MQKLSVPYGAIFALVCGLVIGVATARAEILPPLDAAAAADWRAVGVFNKIGAGGTANCSGTLIAPDLVLTAAHCARARPEKRRFVVGGIGSNALATYTVARIDLHPRWGQSEDIANFKVDMALVTLERPVPPDLATPVSLSDRSVARSYGVVAYHRMRPGGLSGDFECPRGPGSGYDAILLDCQVISGNSGAPALIRQGAGWQVAGVVVAQIDHGVTHQALVAPVDDWLRARVAAHVP